VNPDDFVALGATKDRIAEELAEQISALDGTNAGASTVYALGARPQVELVPSPKTQPGLVDVQAAWLEGTVAVTALLDAEADPVPGAGPRLRIEVDGRESTEVALAGTMTVGRAPGSDIAINHEGVSRNHAILTVADSGEISIVDCGSVNGVALEGTGRIGVGQPFPIRPGQILRLGKRVRLELVSDATQPMPEEDGRPGS
jgi:hypothetical protein